MAQSSTIVIIGAGLAGAKAAEALRDQGFAGKVVLIGNERDLPYERPPLSKGYLLGTSERADVFVHPREWYVEHDIDLRLGSTVTSLDRVERSVRLTDGEPISYDRLLLATGSRNGELPIPGAGAGGVFQFRTLDDSQALKDLLGRIRKLAIIGAGWIGLEIAAAARQADVEVTVIESSALPLLRVLGPTVAAVFRDLHSEQGVVFHFSASVSAIRTDNGTATGVELADGVFVPADAVLVAVGVQPNVELAADAGLAVDGGVLVDKSLRSSDSAIFAAGDVAAADHPFYGRPVHVEHWANALNQPAVAAAGMIGAENDARDYSELPYFFTDQYDLGMEYIGLADQNDPVVMRGDVEGREFLAFWTRDGRVIAGMNVNVWDVVDDVKALITSRVVIDSARLADPEVPLADLWSSTG